MADTSSPYHQFIGVKQVDTYNDFWSITFNGSVPGDSRKYYGIDEVLSAARTLVAQDPDFRTLDEDAARKIYFA